MSRDIGKIKESLLESGRLLSFLEELLPNGVLEGNNYVLGDITGAEGRSLKIKVYGDNAGIYADFNGTSRGDILDLVMQTKNIGFREAVKLVSDFMGIREPKFSFVRTGDKKQYTTPSPEYSSYTGSAEALDYLSSKRGIPAEILTRYGIGITNHTYGNVTGLSIAFPFVSHSGVLNMVKYLLIERPNGKRYISATPNSKPTLFGWQALHPKTRNLVITKGEIEAMTWHYFGFSVLAVPFGEGKNNTWLEHEYDNLSHFEKIIIHADDDAPGRMMVEDLAMKLGRHRCSILLGSPTEGLKDLNDALIAGITSKEVQDWIDTSARSMDPEHLKQATDFKDEVIDLFYSTDPKKIGIPFPIATIGDDFRIRKGEMTIFTGMSGSGKSQLLLQLANYLAENGEKALIASFEMPAAASIGRMLRQRTKSSLPSREEIVTELEWMKDRILFYDFVGSANLQATMEIFEYAVKKFGCTFFVLDSLMKMGISDEDLGGQKEFVDTLQNFSREYKVHTALVAHSKKKLNEDEQSTKYDIRGSATISDLVENVVTVFRNKAKERDLRTMYMNPAAFPQEAIDAVIAQQPDAIISVLKQRHGHGQEPTADCRFDIQAQLFSDMRQTFV